MFRTPLEFEELYQASTHYKQALSSIEMVNNTSVSSVSSEREQFSLPIWRQVYLCSKRQFRVLITNYNNWLIEAGCILVQSLVIGTLFRDEPRETGSFFIFTSSLFFCTLVPALQVMA